MFPRQIRWEGCAEQAEEQVPVWGKSGALGRGRQLAAVGRPNGRGGLGVS